MAEVLTYPQTGSKLDGAGKGHPGCRVWAGPSADTCGDDQEIRSLVAAQTPDLSAHLSPTHSPKQKQELGVHMGAHTHVPPPRGRQGHSLPFKPQVYYGGACFTGDNKKPGAHRIPLGKSQVPALFRPSVTAAENVFKGPTLSFFTSVYESTVISAATSVLKCYPTRGVRSPDTTESAV